MDLSQKYKFYTGQILFILMILAPKLIHSGNVSGFAFQTDAIFLSHKVRLYYHSFVQNFNTITFKPTK